MGPHQRLALALDGLDGSGKLREAALHRLDGRAQRGALEGLGQCGVANLHAPEQVADCRLVGVRIDDEAADRTVLDARPDQLETGPELLRELVAERLEDRFVVGVEHQRSRIQPQPAQRLVVEVGELGHERDQSPQRLEEPGQQRSLVAERLQRAGRGPRPAARGAPARRAARRRLRRARRARCPTTIPPAWRADGAARDAPNEPARRPARRRPHRRARSRSPRGRAAAAPRRAARPRAGGRGSAPWSWGRARV